MFSTTQTGFEFDKPRCDGNLSELPSLDGISSIGFDTETTTEPWLFDRTLVGISYYLPDGRKGYIPLRHPGGGNLPEEQVRRWAQRELRDKLLVVDNGKHEHHTLKKWGIDFEEQGCTFNDVLYSASLLQEKRYRVNMDILCEEEGLPRIKANHKLLHELPASEAALVAIEDAELAWKLAQLYQPRLRNEGLERVQTLENDLIFSTCEMERNGSHLDVELLLRWSGEVQQELEARIMRLRRETGMALSPTKGADMSRLFRFLGIENDYKTETGQESWDEEHLTEFLGYHELVNVALEARQLSSFWSKYFKNYIASVRPDGRIYYSLHQLRGDEGGACTGRYSSSKMYKADEGGCNIQQVVKTKKMPRLLQRWPVRKLYVAPEGEEWVSSDASQIEYRDFAHYAALCGMPRLAESYRQDPKRDFHAMVQQWTGLNRDHTKNVNFAKLYGGGVDKIWYMINMVNKVNGEPLITRFDAQDIVENYDREFPEANVLMRLTERVAKQRGYVCTHLGRRRRFDREDPKERFYSALNCVLQGGSAELMKLKLREVYKNRRSLGLKMRSTVHDEKNSTKPKGPEGRNEISAFMNRQELELQVPIIYETGFGPNWEEAK